MSKRSGLDETTFQNEMLRALESGRRREDGFAMLTVILLTMVLAAVSVLMLGVVVSQVKPTVFEAKNNRTIAAAEAGVDAALSQLRTATRVDLAGNVFGDPHKLPCTVVGTVTQNSATLGYDVQITYFTQNPADKDAVWRTIGSNVIACTPGSGTMQAPSFALITAQGKDAAVAGYAGDVGNRTLETVYTFQVVNKNVDGGIMYNWGRSACLHADSATPNSTVVYQAAGDCIDDALNMWSYKSDYTIRLASTDFAGSMNPLCLTGRPTSGGNVNATLKACSTPPATNQLFAWHEGARFFVVNADGRLDDTYCLGAGSALSDPAGHTAMVGWCGYNDPAGSFDPDPRVGAGKASYDTNQIVSFLEFGRCFDVTDMDVNKYYMILYPCKQAPGTAESLAWNHRWFYTEPASPTDPAKYVGTSTWQQVKVYKDDSHSSGNTYCLKSPRTDGGLVTLALCSTGGQSLNWKRTALTGTYGLSWTLTDADGRCASVGAKATEAGRTAWSTIVVAQCTGGPEQKWNAPTNAQTSTLDNYKEIN